jgi:hypothetical protein
MKSTLPILSLAAAIVAAALWARGADAPFVRPIAESADGGETAREPRENGSIAPESGVAIDRSPDANRSVDAGALLAQSADLLARQTSIEAKIRQTIDLFGQKIAGSGAYWQQGRGGERGAAPRMLFRVEMRFPIAGGASSLLEVHDGKYLWIHRQLAGESTLSRVDVEQLQQACEEAAASSDASDASDPRSPTQFNPLQNPLALGGLPKLLVGLHEHFDWQVVREQTINDVPVYIFAGRWKPGVLSAASLDAKNLPEPLPDRVVVYLGQDNLLPYVVQLQRRAETEGADYRTIVSTEWYDLRLGGPIPESQFVYESGEQKVWDITERYLPKPAK